MTAATIRAAIVGPMSIDVRPIHDDELVPWLDAGSTGFLDRPDIAKIAEEVRPHWDLARVWAAIEADRIVGTFRSWGSDLTVPGGGQVKAASITGVGVLPTHRRRGILSGMAAREHEAARGRDEVVSMLYASEYPIYGRFGYGPATTTATWTVDAKGTGFHPSTGMDGALELIAPDESGEATAREVFDTWRARQPGEIWRRPITWLADFGRGGPAWGPPWKGFVVVHRDDAGAVDGYVRYHADEKWEQRLPRSLLVVDDLHALTDGAYASLWRFLGTIDWVATVKAEKRSPSERLPWLLTNARAAVPSDIGDGLWIKLLDIPVALAARTYDRPGSLVLEIVERDRVDGEGRTRLLVDASPDGATCAATSRSPDLTIAASALGAAYLGGTRLRDAVRASGCDEHRSGALADADALFLSLDPPWCSTFF
jgi:predicted acetyltransferase